MTKEFVDKLIKDFKDKNILIIGDVMVDSYIWGKVNRISPEAPVPVVSITSRENRLGGAANVALNIKALGANPIICSVIGKDSKGEIFTSLLHKRNMTNEGIVKTINRKTTSKTRIISIDQQLMRVDEEDTCFLEKETEMILLNKIKDISEKSKIDAIVFQDYDKGVINKSLICSVVSFANKKNIKTAVDPKYNNFTSYKNVSLFKPNFKEFKQGLKLDISINDFDAIFENAAKFRKNLNINCFFYNTFRRRCYYYR